ncbi:hypothetical protein H1C71_022094 [Ictidomys tridecemlineatus]|nr:hypothetical protein H1C71_022094 [Ictidomys tridecemlineatus]
MLRAPVCGTALESPVPTAEMAPWSSPQVWQTGSEEGPQLALQGAFPSSHPRHKITCQSGNQQCYKLPHRAQRELRKPAPLGHPSCHLSWGGVSPFLSPEVFSGRSSWLCHSNHATVLPVENQ